MNSPRAQDEIVARIHAIAEDDFFGFGREVLLLALDFDHARPFLKDGATAESWDDARAERSLEKDARQYLDFAVRKILDHRGISASRSVSKLTEFAWLLARDDVVSAMEAQDYAQYGAPQVKAFADGMGYPWSDDPALARMAAGDFCRPGCESGCGL